VHDPTDPVGRVLFNVLAMVAEFEADLARAHTPRRHQGRKAKSGLRGKQPKLSPDQEAHPRGPHRAGAHDQRAGGAVLHRPLEPNGQTVERLGCARGERHLAR